jgi:hypothetical protein
MKQCFYNQVWKPLKNLVKMISGRGRNDDDQLNDPYIIF